jgi:hypothetical protein
VKTWVSIAEASRHFGLARGTMYSLAARGLLPPGSILKLGRQIRVNVEKIEAQADKAKRT